MKLKTFTTIKFGTIFFVLLMIPLIIFILILPYTQIDFDYEAFPLLAILIFTISLGLAYNYTPKKDDIFSRIENHTIKFITNKRVLYSTKMIPVVYMGFFGPATLAVILNFLNFKSKTHFLLNIVVMIPILLIANGKYIGPYEKTKTNIPEKEYRFKSFVSFWFLNFYISLLFFAPLFFLSKESLFELGISGYKIFLFVGSFIWSVIVFKYK